LLVFLKIFRVCPDSGIAARYAPWFICRQGQKLKAQALSQSLNPGNIEVTKTGRITALTLTEKGMVLMFRIAKMETVLISFMTGYAINYYL